MNSSIRTIIAQVLDWEDAHASFDKVVSGLSPTLRGQVPAGLPYSLWQLLEHLRITQQDILDFCVNASYTKRDWPDDYWPRTKAPASDSAWDESVESYRKDREALKRLALDESVDLMAVVTAGEDQTYLRELLLVADHTAYHLGEMVVVRRALGAWPPK
jgi:uncharacterized damage-inducible protein DinB